MGQQQRVPHTSLLTPRTMRAKPGHSTFHSTSSTPHPILSSSSRTLSAPPCLPTAPASAEYAVAASLTYHSPRYSTVQYLSPDLTCCRQNQYWSPFNTVRIYSYYLLPSLPRHSGFFYSGLCAYHAHARCCSIRNKMNPRSAAHVAQRHPILSANHNHRTFSSQTSFSLSDSSAMPVCAHYLLTHGS